MDSVLYLQQTGTVGHSAKTRKREYMCVCVHWYVCVCGCMHVKVICMCSAVFLLCLQMNYFKCYVPGTFYWPLHAASCIVATSEGNTHLFPFSLQKVVAFVGVVLLLGVGSSG
jgi:hypothetical protein